jgi:hypothetical protein
MTLASERFMAIHMIYERIAPDAPISEPTVVSSVLLSMKPSAQRAQPE